MCKKKKNVTVNVTCCGISKKFNSIKQAEDFFWDCADNSEGTERERYMYILSQLHRGITDCSDIQKFL